MGKYRNRLEIVADILRVVSSKGARKTHIMYKCNLSYTLLTRYLKGALDAKLMCKDGGNNCYLLTKKGQQFLQKFKTYVAQFEELQKQAVNIEDEKASLEGMLS